MDAYLSNTVPSWPTRILYLVSNFSSFIFQPVSAFSISAFCFQLWHFRVRFQASACTCRKQRIYFSAFCSFWSFGFQLIGFSFYLLTVRMQLLTFAIFRVSRLEFWIQLTSFNRVQNVRLFLPYFIAGRNSRVHFRAI